MVKLKGLGRGLDALLESGDAERSGESLQTLRVDALRPGKYQPRTRMDEGSLAELAASIREQGVMQPILVRPVDGQRYEIIAGERRWRAAQIAGLGEVPALVRRVPDRAALALALVENIQRENLNPLEEAQGLHRLIEEFGLTHEQAAQAIGRSRSAVTNLLRLTHLAKPVQEMLHEGRLDMGHARHARRRRAQTASRATEGPRSRPPPGGTLGCTGGRRAARGQARRPRPHHHRLLESRRTRGHHRQAAGPRLLSEGGCPVSRVPSA
jgi:ParB/RepB/Spo0J family partition protein